MTDTIDEHKKDLEIDAVARVLKTLRPLSRRKQLYVLGSAAYYLGSNAQASALFGALAEELRNDSSEDLGAK